jgi:hypothetical protein
MQSHFIPLDTTNLQLPAEIGQSGKCANALIFFVISSNLKRAR